MSSHPAVRRYACTPLPFIPFSNVGGEALNNNGVVAGGIANSDGSVSLAQWSNGELTPLGVPPGLPSRNFNIPRVFGMNDYGAVVGTLRSAAGDVPSRWFIHDRGRFTVLPLADPTDRGGAAVGINNQGEIVGYQHAANNRLTAWRWFNGVYSRLSISGTSMAALGINAAGIIVGNRRLRFVRRLLTGQLRSRGELGYILSHGKVQYLSGFVYAINQQGEAAGGCVANGRTRATVFTNGIASVILNLPSHAVGINSAASVVGSFQPTGCRRKHLFQWSANAGAFDLTPEGYVSAEAAAINNRGDILGFGETASGKSEYFLLTPDPAGELTSRAVITAPTAIPSYSRFA